VGLKNILINFALCFCAVTAAQTNTEVKGTNERIVTSTPAASSGSTKTVRLDVSVYLDEENVRATSGETRSSVATLEVLPRFYLTPQMYLMPYFQQVQGQVVSNPARGSRSKTEISGFMEPSLEWAMITSGNIRYCGGLLYRFDTGSAKSTDQIISPKKGGQAIEPLAGLEVDLKGYLLGVEYRYTIEGTRHQQSNDTQKTLTAGNRHFLYTFIEQTTEFGPGVGFAYFQKAHSIVDGADEDPGYTKVYGRFYLQIPVFEDTTLIPILSYSKNLETQVQDETISRNENFNLTVTARARF
jgi:hypothetical protein